mgnify:CR=1 FL=1
MPGQGYKYVEMTLKEAENAIVEEFSMYDEWLDKYEYLIELGKALKDYPEDAKTEDRLIKGCQSRVWLDYSVEDGKIIFNADSDAIITKGIIALLVRVMNGRTPQEIVEMEPYFIDAIGLGENLSPTRSNGLVAMIKQMKMYALAFASKA